MTLIKFKNEGNFDKFPLIPTVFGDFFNATNHVNFVGSRLAVVAGVIPTMKDLLKQCSEAFTAERCLNRSVS